MPNETADIIAELQKISRLMAVTALRDLNQRERIELLGTAGFQPKEIADLLNTTPNTVSVELSKIRRRKASARRSKQTDSEND